MNFVTLTYKSLRDFGGTWISELETENVAVHQVKF